MSTHKSHTVRTQKRIHNRQADYDFQAGILPSPPLIINNSISSYPPVSYTQKQPPLLPLPSSSSFLKNSTIKTQNHPLVKGLSFPTVNTKPIKNRAPSPNTSLIAPRKSTSSLSTTFNCKNIKQSITADNACSFSKDAVSAGGSRASCGVHGTKLIKNPSKIEELSPKLLEEIDKYWESVIFTLSPPPSSLPMPTSSILRPKLR